MPAANVRPGDVNELMNNHLWMTLANHLSCQIEMVVMQHDDDRTIFAFDLGVHRFSYGRISDCVPVHPGVLQPANSRGSIGIVHVVLQKPEYTITGLLVMFLVHLPGKSNITQLHLLTSQRRRKNSSL